jgi:PAS domain S-box-containing protein
MESNEVEVLKRALERQKKARAQAEKILEDKSKELYNTAEHLKRANILLENLLDERTDEFNAAFLGIIDPYVVMDLDFNVIRSNESAKEFLKFDSLKTEVNLSHYVHPDFAQYTAASMKSLMKTGVLKNYRAKIILPDGTQKYVQINASIIYDREANPIAAQGIVRDITQEKEIEGLLNKQRRQLDIIVDNSPLGIALLEKGEILKSNTAMQEMLGYGPEELKNIKMEDVSFAEGLEQSKVFMDEMEAGTRDHYSLNKSYIRKDGARIMVKTTVNAVRNPEGDISYQVAIVEDITKEVQAKQQLKESENRLATLIKNLEMAVLLEDENRNIALTNKKFCEMFGVQANPEAMIGANCANAAEETKGYFKNPEQFIARITEILKNQETVLSDELEMVDGRILERDYIPVINDGVYKGHLWSYRDVTLTKTFRQNLQAEKDKYSGIIANMNLGLIEVDPNGQIQTVNQSFCTISGFEMEELVGSVVHELRTANNKPIIDNKDIEQLKKGQDSHEMAVFNKKGEQRHWLVSSAPLFDQAHRAIGSIGIHLDITEHKKLQLEKEKLLSKLEQSNESLKEYAYVVSHDLKSPLRSIEALASWLSNDYADSLDDAGKEYLKLIQDKIESMENLISGILAYSTANTSELNNTEFDLHEVVSRIEDSIFIPEHVKLVVPKTLPRIIADKTKVHQLFQNIISNAVVHIEKENGLVEILYNEEPDHWQFCIKDNGVGIPKKYHQKIFEIFQSASNDKKSTGIGLSIVKKIIDRYNGTVWIESEEGAGTDFYFTLEKQTLISNPHEDLTSQKTI